MVMVIRDDLAATVVVWRRPTVYWRRDRHRQGEASDAEGLSLAWLPDQPSPIGA